MLKKNHIIYLMVAVSTLSCGKKFLDKKPIARATDATFYKTEDDIVAAVNAAYDPLGWDNDASGSFHIPDFWWDVCSDDAVKGGDGAGDQPYASELETFTARPSNIALSLNWNRWYTGIYRANLVIERAPKSNASKQVIDRVVGEAHFLRALYYQKLVNVFGGVPLVDHVLSSSEYTKSRATELQIYALIESDFATAATLLPEKGGIEVGRATKGAALGLLARAYLHQTSTRFGDPSSKWQKVFSTCETVINSKKYNLVADYATIHLLAGEHNDESLFEVENISGTTGYGNANEGTIINVMLRGRSEGGWGFNRPSMDLANEFESGDPRYEATIIDAGRKIYPDENAYINTTDITKYPFTNKYSRKYIEPIKAVVGQSQGPSNVRVIRYSDVLLMYAEAANELGKTSEALAKLKEVRDRVKLPEVKETDKLKLRELIWHERRVELALEQIRFFDLVRQDRAYEVMKKFSNEEGGGLFKKGVNEIFPIPATEIDISQGAIVQNPGYN